MLTDKTHAFCDNCEDVTIVEITELEEDSIEELYCKPVNVSCDRCKFIYTTLYNIKVNH